MSDLVGNPEDRFSRVAAQISTKSEHVSTLFYLAFRNNEEYFQIQLLYTNRLTCPIQYESCDLMSTICLKCINEYFMNLMHMFKRLLSNMLMAV